MRNFQDEDGLRVWTSQLYFVILRLKSLHRPLLIMNNPFDYTPDPECEEAFHRLIAELETFRESDSPDDRAFCRELEAGKMLGVLIASDSEGAHHTLYAFSGQLGNGGFHRDGFVGPVFDYLRPDGHFKTKEAEISLQNAEIARYEEVTLAEIQREYESAAERLHSEVAEYQERCRTSKLERERRRTAGVVSDSEEAAMIRQSQFEKAELRRIKKRTEAELSPLLTRLNDARAQLTAMKERRRADSEALQNWLFSNFNLLNARGESKSLISIFADTSLKVPPSGAGECCAPKLLHTAYLNGWQPLAMAEYWYGKPKRGEVRRHGEHYPACRGKCLPVLTWMLQGLSVDPPLENSGHRSHLSTPEIIYENEWFCVVDKPAGILSVPGKGEELSLQEWLTERYGKERLVKPAHRLDQDTSGLLIATFGERSFKVMQSLFATRKVSKVYVAELDGDYEAKGIAQHGRIALPLSPDRLDRPRQRVDLDEGKEALTDYLFTGKSGGRSRIEFYPLTGRTHQLRVHAASEMGLGLPIAGDRLYGRSGGKDAERLHLHARCLEFIFPEDGRSYSFESLPPF